MYARIQREATITANTALLLVSLATEDETKASVNVYEYAFFPCNRAAWMAYNLSWLTWVLVRILSVPVVCPVCTVTTLTGMLAELVPGVGVAVGEATGVLLPVPAVGVTPTTGEEAGVEVAAGAPGLVVLGNLLSSV